MQCRLFHFDTFNIGRILLAVLLSACFSVDPVVAVEHVRIDSLRALRASAKGDEPVAVSIDLSGVVRWSSARDGRIILDDDETIVQLELDFPCAMPGQGDRVVIEGECLVAMNRKQIRLSRIPVIDNDGIHDMEQKSGTLHLDQGFHPIQVSWFERTGSLGLEMTYKTPLGPFQPIPDEQLFHRGDDGGYVHGLNYRSFEGAWWRILPNFDHMSPVGSGVVDNFDISIKSREHHTGVEFSGFLKIEDAGDYTFRLRSDDGSRLFIGESSVSIRVTGRLGPDESLHMLNPDSSEDFQWLETEGTVRSFHRSEGALEIEIMTRHGLVKVNVAEDSGSSHTLMLQNRIRVAGLSRVIRTVDRGWVRGEVFVQTWEDVGQLYVVPQIWSKYPVTDVASLLSSKPFALIGSIVHLSGRLEREGTALVLNDGSGRIHLEGAVPEGYVGRDSDILGRVKGGDQGVVIEDVYCRTLESGGGPTNQLSILTRAEEICQLSREEAAKGYPVRVRGVITSIMDYKGVFEGVVIQDTTRGILVNTAGNQIPLEIGDYCEIEGTTSPYGFQPDILYSRIESLGISMLPDPIRPTWDQLINGTMHCNFVELEGVVTSVNEFTVNLLTRNGSINVRLNGEGVSIPANSIGATLRLRGTLIADWDEESRQVMVGSIYLDQQKITVINPAPVDPFAIPLKQISDLLQFDPQAGALQRVKVSGTLIYSDSDQSFLINGDNGLSFVVNEPHSYPINSVLEVVGFVDLSGQSPMLRYAVVRELGRGDSPEPLKINADAVVNAQYDARLVRVRGELLGISGLPEEAVLDMQAGMHRFSAKVADQEGLAEFPETGSLLELDGVYVGVGGNRVLGLPIDSFRLLVNSGDHVRVLAKPPWWTFKRLMLLVGVLVGAMLAALIWINLLHRRVEERTQELGDQIRKRQLIERQRAIENERARLAHDLHDDLGSGLTEVNLLAVLASSPKTPADKRVEYTGEMNKLLTRMSVSLDEIVWAENPKNDTITSLAGYFGAHAQRLLGMASIGCGLEMAEGLPDEPLDPKFRQELFLAFKEALNNVIKHAKANKVWLRIFIRGNDLVVVVTDDGCGIKVDGHEEGEDGLINMRNRMRALGGQCTVHSVPGEGTTVTLQAPVRTEET